jgi:hyaluronate lyase
VDPLLLPGTTTKTGDPGPLDATPMGATPHSGGVRRDERHGAYALDFVSADGTLSAKKSWFFTPHGIVCLGAGITDDSGERVRTTIENRNLGEDGTATLRADGFRVSPTGTLRHKRWLHLDGVGGYRVLDHADVIALREDRTGAWRDIDTGANTKGTTVPYTRRYQKLLIDHGVRPANASYAYAVLPTASVVDTAVAVVGQVRANTPTVQAIRLPDGTLLANFFAAGSVDGVSVSGPASLALSREHRGGRLDIADPTQLQDSVRVSVRGHTVSVPLIGACGATRTVLLGR